MTNTTKTTEKKYPTHLIFLVTPIPGSDKSNWLKVAAVWANKDGKGFNIVPEHPITPGGKYVMRPYSPKTDR